MQQYSTRLMVFPCSRAHSRFASILFVALKAQVHVDDIALEITEAKLNNLANFVHGFMALLNGWAPIMVHAWSCFLFLFLFSTIFLVMYITFPQLV